MVTSYVETGPCPHMIAPKQLSLQLHLYQEEEFEDVADYIARADAEAGVCEFLDKQPLCNAFTHLVGTDVLFHQQSSQDYTGDLEEHEMGPEWMNDDGFWRCVDETQTSEEASSLEGDRGSGLAESAIGSLGRHLGDFQNV